MGTIYPTVYPQPGEWYIDLTVDESALWTFPVVAETGESVNVDVDVILHSLLQGVAEGRTSGGAFALIPKPLSGETGGVGSALGEHELLILLRSQTGGYATTENARFTRTPPENISPFLVSSSDGSSETLTLPDFWAESSDGTANGFRIAPTGYYGLPDTSLTGAADGHAAASGTQRLEVFLVGGAGARSSGAAPVALGIELHGGIDGRGGGAAAVFKSVDLPGTGDGKGTGVGGLRVTVPISGGATGKAGATGDVAITPPTALSGAADGAADATGTPRVQATDFPITGAAAAKGGATGAPRVVPPTPLSGTAGGKAGGVGDEDILIPAPLSGDAGGKTGGTVYPRIVPATPLAGDAGGKAGAGGTARVVAPTPLSGRSEGHAGATVILGLPTDVSARPATGRTAGRGNLVVFNPLTDTVKTVGMALITEDASPEFAVENCSDEIGQITTEANDLIMESEV